MGSSSSSLLLQGELDEAGDDEMSKARAELEEYGDHQELIRTATNDPSGRMKTALEYLKPSIDAIVGWYELSERLASTIPGMLDNDGTLVEQLAFLIDFDSKKQLKPSIQNDFSFVKRANAVDSRNAGLVSMFIAQSSPMLLRVAAELSPRHAQRLSSISSLCCAALADKRLPPQSRPKCVSAMTAAFILYDRIEPGGAFSKNKKLARKVATAIQKHATHPPSIFGQFRYTTLGYNDKASTAVKKIVEKET